jgi:hypothetical protein
MQISIDEAIRIGTVIRVLFHDTKNSTSLLTQIGAGTLRILSTVRPIPPGAIFADGIGLFQMTSEQTNVRPKLGSGSFKGLMGRDSWWNQVIAVSNRLEITRRAIVLASTNKDGGAHVDPKLTPEYQELRRGIWDAVEQDGTAAAISDYQFIFLRQAGYEVLNSPELIALAGQ